MRSDLRCSRTVSRPSWLKAPLPLGDAIVRPGARTDRRVERAHDASINPLHELGRALTAALLPPLGVAIAGMWRLSAGWKIAAVALLFVAVGALFAREGRYRAALLDALSGFTFWLPFVVLLVALAVLVVTGAYGSFADAVVAGGFAGWLAALVLRLVGFATACSRIAFVVLALVASAASFVSLFVLQDGVDVGVLVVFWAAALVSLAIVVINEQGRDPGIGRLGLNNPGRPGATMLTLQQWGLSFSLAATLAFVAASVVSAASGPPPTEKENRLQFAAGGDVRIESIRGVSDTELAERFSPVLEFSEQQRWDPVAVDDFLSASALHWTNGIQIVPKGSVTRADLWRDCPRGVAAPCYELRLGCSAKDSDNAQRNCSFGRRREKGLHAGGHAYVRVLRWRDRQGYPRRPAQPPPFGRKIRKLLQYWLFYPYDDWHAQTLYGDLRQTHEGDWEAVTIGFSDDAPLFAAYSSHCGGTWRDWADVRLARPGPTVMRDTHLVVGVAEGSQANYAAPDAARAPNWAPCAGIPSDKASAATFAYNVRDQTGEWRALTIPDDQLDPVGEHSAVMGFPGYWGSNASASFETKLGKEYVLQRSGRGPAGPPFQALWAEPLERIFCTATWAYDGPRSFEDCGEQRARLERERRARDR